jgi:hypothetical protein
MNLRVLCLHAAAKRLKVPERTLRYQASRGRIQGAFKQGKLWKFRFPAQAISGRDTTVRNESLQA